VKILRNDKELWVAEDILFDTEYRLAGEDVSDFSDIISQIGSSPHRRIVRLHDQIVFNRERLSISKKAADAANEFEEFAKEIHVKSRLDHFKMGWDT
jgi:hypothetical protein